MFATNKFDLTFTAVARKIAYSIIFTGFIVIYIVITIRPPVDYETQILEPVTESLKMLANQSDPAIRTFTLEDYIGVNIDCNRNITNGTTLNKLCLITPPDDVLSIEIPEFLSNYRNPCWAIPEDYLEGPPITCLPYFYLIGAPKSGTTDLYERMSRHPQISGIVKKELHWFTRRRFKYTTEVKLPQLPYFSNYTDLFNLAAQDIFDNEIYSGYHKKVVGDYSVSTLWDNSYGVMYEALTNHTIARTTQSIHHLNPNTKFVAIIRNPVERTYSDFLYFNSDEEKSQEIFHNMVIEGINFYQTCLKYLSAVACLDRRMKNKDNAKQQKVRVWVGLYYYYLKEYMDVFSREQMYVMKLEDYAPNPEEYLREVFQFLELDPISNKTLKRVADLGTVANQQTRKIGDMYNRTRKLLQDFFSPYNDMLAGLLGDNFNYNHDNRPL